MQRLLDAVRTIPDFPEPGIQFKDITPILARADLLRVAIELLAKPFKDSGITCVVGIEARGFILGAMLAEMLDVGFVPIRKKGKLPSKTVTVTYDLEYGTDSIEMHDDAIHSGDNVLIHDDVIATGGTAAAAEELIRVCGGNVGGYAFLVELEALNGRSKLRNDIPVNSILML